MKIKNLVRAGPVDKEKAAAIFEIHDAEIAAKAARWKKALSKISCSKCVAPGTCCKAIPITTSFPLTALAAEVDIILSKKLMNDTTDGHNPGPNPFRAIRQSPMVGFPLNVREDNTTTWLFECTALQPDGSCGIYDFRPRLCRRYVPGSDNLCVHAVNTQTMKPVIPQARVRQRF